MNQEKPQEPIVLSDWITPQEAAEIIKVTPHQVRHLARTGTIQAKKFGRAWLISRESAQAYAAADRHPGPRADTAPDTR